MINGFNLKLKFSYFWPMQQIFQKSHNFDTSTLAAHKLSFTWSNEAQDDSLDGENHGEYF